MSAAPVVTFAHLVLTTTAPVAVGDPRKATKEMQLPIQRGSGGEPVVPGTTVAGSLRAHVAASADQAAVRRLFGDVVGNSARASAVRVLGTRVVSGEGIDERSSTAIDRRTGAADNRTLRTAEHLPAGTRIEAFLSWTGLDEADEQVLLARLACWHPQIGRSVTAGLGGTRLASARVGTVDLASAEGRRTWLTSSGPELVERVADRPLEILDPEVNAPVIDVEWRISSAMRVGGGPQERDGHKVQSALRSGDGFVVPGSSWKGVFRSRVEWILRTLGDPACLDGSCGQCEACELFGWSPAESEQSDVDPPLTGARGRISFPDTLVEGAVTALRTHVAVDRFTGGAREQLLFTDEVLVGGHMHLLVVPLAEVSERQRRLLWLVVRDIHDGLIGIGSATTRGQGVLELAREDDVAHAMAALEDATEVAR